MKKFSLMIGLVLIGIFMGVSGVYLASNVEFERVVNEPKQIREDNDNATFATDIYNSYASSVVSVVNLKQISIRDFFGNTYTTDEQVQQGVGSGFIYKKDNGYYYALTNNHVVDGSDSINIVLNSEDLNEDNVDENVIDADIVGTDEDYDVAVLRFKSDKDITPVELGTSENLLPGQNVVAIGSPYGTDFQGTITKGIISAPTRTLTGDSGDAYTYIQTDAAINPGNSGGPLFDEDGRVIGMNNMKIADSESDNMGFAIPIDTAIEIATQIEENA